MKGSRLLVSLSCIAGVATSLSLIAWAGIGPIEKTLDQITWQGFAQICLLQLPALGLCAAGWWVLPVRTSYGACLTARWVREGAANLASIIPILGEVVGARILALFGVSTP